MKNYEKVTHDLLERRERYVADQKMKRKRIMSVATSLGCLCLVALLGIGIWRSGMLTTPPITLEDNSTISGNRGNVIWGNDAGDNAVEDYGDEAAKGTIIIAESLENAMKNSDNEKDLFAVMVTEMTGAAPNDVYNTFVKPLNINEEYLETGVIFVSKTQITALECPSDFSLFLSLAIKPYEDKLINQETLDTTVSESIKVKVYLKYNVDAILSQYQEQLSGLSNEEYQQMQQSIIKTEISQMVNKFIADYEISAESISEIGIYIPEFTAELDAALISKIIKDERVELVLEVTDSAGMDQFQ